MPDNDTEKASDVVHELTQQPSQQQPLPRRTELMPVHERRERNGVVPKTNRSPMVLLERPHPTFEFTDPGSISVGTVTFGHLVRGREIPLEGDNHFSMEEHSSRRTRWTTDEFFDLFQLAAAAVGKKHPGFRLALGNAARQGGGDLPWSISHNSGRDVDFGFYLVDTHGNRIEQPTMFSLSEEGPISHQGVEYRFHAFSNWTFVRTLLESESPRVQYIFAADFLIDQMFAVAREEGIAEDTLEAYRKRLRQPRGTLPHDDHFHIRIYCDTADQLEGCRDIVYGREIIPRKRADFRQRVRDLRRLLTDKKQSQEKRADAAWTLGILHAHTAASDLGDVLKGCREPLCDRAVGALLNLKTSPPSRHLVTLLKRTDHLPTARLAFRLLRRSSPTDTRTILDLLAVERTLTFPRLTFQDRLNIREHACYVLGHMGNRRRSTFKPLVALLRSEDEDVAAAALWAIRALAAAPIFSDLGDDQFDGLWKRFKAWYRGNRNRTRTFASTLRAKGHDVSHHLSRRSDTRKLIPLILEEDYISINAQLVLQDLIDHDVQLDISDKLSAHWLIRKKWKRWRRHH